MILFSINLENLKKIYEKTMVLAKKEMAMLYILDTIVAMLVVFVMLLVICSLLGKLIKKPLPWVNRIGYAFAGAYGIFVVELAILAREADSRSGIFNSSMFSPKLTEIERIYIFLNVMFFVPFAIALALGLYYQFKALGAIFITTLATFAFSFFVETSQRLTGRGYYEVADLQANTLGGFIGALVGAGIGAIIFHNHQKNAKKTKKAKAKKK